METVTLAPAAGAGIGKQIADLLLADPEFLPAMVGALKGALSAESGFYCKATGMIEYAVDHKTRLNAVLATLAHMEGEPFKRIIHQHLGAGGALDIVGTLRESPAVVAALEREMEKA